MKKFNLIKLIICTTLMLFALVVVAQSNPDVDCPAPPTFLVGDYQVTDVNATVGPSNSSENFESGIYTITGQGNTRTFQTGILPAFNSDIETVSFILNCGIIQIEDVDPNLTCDGGVSSYIFTTTDDANSTTYSLTGSDDSFIINYIEDPQGSCGGPFTSSFSINKVCSEPQNIEFLNATSTSVEVSWLDTNNTSSTGNTYTVEYGLQGFSLGSGLTVTGISGNSTTINNLQPDTAYDFYVSASCTDATSSQVAGPFEHEFINNSDFTLAANGVTCLCPNANVGDSGTLNINGVAKTFTKRTRADLDAIIANDINDPEIALTCTSGITDMSYLFSNETSFNQNLEHWDVSNVTTMSFMFNGATAFNQPLNDWNVSNVIFMGWMFKETTAFNQSLNNWDVSSVTDMTFMFFRASAFNQPLNNWDVSSVTSMNSMFREASAFNQPLNDWDVSSVTVMQSMFREATSFNQPLNDWDVSNVIFMGWMFNDATSFDQPLNDWDVSSVKSMSSMFRFATAFNQPLNDWDVGSVSNMVFMFDGATVFNQPLNDWDVSNVTFMNQMFNGASSFNQPLNDWVVSNVTNMSFMFNEATAFNQPLDDWNVVSVTNMDAMFADSNFNQDISSWCVEQIEVLPTNFATNSPLQSNFIPSWGVACNITNADFVLDSNNVTCLCPDAAIGDVGTININGELRTFTKRSENMLRGLVNADINNQQIALTCTSAVTDMSNLFKDKANFNQTLEHWDVSNVTDMSGMFENATSFNIPTDDSDVDLMSELSSSNLLLSEWDVSNVTNMDFMFKNATVFNQDISSWCVEQIPSEPTEFSLNSALQDSFKPNWGATCTLSVQDVNFVNIKVYPNPTADKVYIENPNTIRIDQIKVFNMLGKVVQEKNNINQNQTNIDLSELATGTYIVQILTQDAQKFVKRVIKK